MYIKFKLFISFLRKKTIKLWWKLAEADLRDQFTVQRGKQKYIYIQQSREGTQDWEAVIEYLRQLGEKLLGKTYGKMKPGKETWWWNEQESIQTKTMANRTIDKDNNEENRAAYKTPKDGAKKNVAIAKFGAYYFLYDTTE